MHQIRLQLGFCPDSAGETYSWRRGEGGSEEEGKEVERDGSGGEVEGLLHWRWGIDTPGGCHLSDQMEFDMYAVQTAVVLQQQRTAA